MKYAILLLLASCGLGLGREIGSKHDITVRRYESVSGDESVVDPNSLGFTYFAETRGNAEHGALGMNCLINRLSLDGDPRLVNVIEHELLNALALCDGDGYTPEWPRELDGDWILWDGDSRDPLYVSPPDEAMWIANHHKMRVHVQDRDAWLLVPVRHACNRLNGSALTEVFVAP